MPLLVRLILSLLALAVGMGAAAAAVVIGLYLYHAPTLPDVDSLREVQLQTPLQILTRDRKLIAEFAEQRREPVPIEEIPERLVQAFVAAEDERFFRHHGVDPLGLLRAGINLFTTGERTQGGSTITMQLARNFFLTRERTYERKIREIFLAVQIERELTKDQIMGLYLNKIYLGQRAYGVAAAARVYFNRDLDQLELDQMAILAALPKAPSTTNPITDPQRAENRRNYVLRRMLELGWISTEEHAWALAQPVLSQRHANPSEVDARWVAESARQIVFNLWGDEAYVRGLRVITTIDSAAQEAANAALRGGLLEYDQRHGYRGPELRLDETVTSNRERRHAALAEIGISGRILYPAVVLAADATSVHVDAGLLGEQQLGGDEIAWARPGEGPVSSWLQPGDVIRVEQTADGGLRLSQKPEASGALVAQAPRDGAILALTGGFDFFDNKFDHALQAQRQPGSAFKPLIYAVALRDGMTPASTLVDAPLVFSDPALGAEWRPENYGRRFHGATDMRDALAHSRNLASIRLLNSVGVSKVHDDLSRFGINRDDHPRNLSMALGTGVVTPIELNNAYIPFANGGLLTSPWLIGRIETAGGTVLYEAPTPQTCSAPCTRPAGQEMQLVTANKPLQYADPVPTIEPGVAWQMSEMLGGVIRSGTGRAALDLGRNDLGGKTGTTNAYRDAWFVGFNAEIAATAWIGFDDNRELGASESGGRAALPIWTRFMREALAGTPEAPVERPAELVRVAILPETGQRTTDDDPRARPEWLLPEQIPERGIPSAPAAPGSPAGQTRDAQPEFIF